MTLTELALLRLLPPTTSTTPSLLSALSHAKTVMESYTHHHFHMLQQVEDPALIYILGEWDSLAQHMDGFIPSAENQELLKSLDGMVEVVSLVHYDVPLTQLPIPGAGKGGKGLVSIARHFIKPGQKETFEETFEANKGLLQEYVAPEVCGWGWRVDREKEADGQGEKEEFVLFSPWESVDAHLRFGKTEAFKRYAGIREWIDGADIKHARVLELGG
ncbi:uncharacterized protein BDZ99DRAFT_468104 [Mytilinidion resinicola]|uniref:ABM domain-containing protein n=1 Tax=Mytilinidion resinicola TaxID=574789 RepID=A0A6A6Y6C5_9PEZI|nr:uncharacterized protein BDZ99DRAFT_468104 [Mytilinidion resinicola]KAF2803564.1 hypothetical protein BDZ99DRAFT_468104 [Mytilinidion resinicola]